MHITDNLLLFITSGTGLLFVVVALISMKFPPKKINYIYGYRTKSSMKSQERWGFAQKYSSKYFLFIGIFLVVIGLLSIFIPLDKSLRVYMAILLIVLSLLVFFYNTENQLKKKFK